MRKFLDIIIPEYNCPVNFIVDLLDSISNQKRINLDEIGIIIINDASSDKLDKKIFEYYSNLDIKYIVLDENVGQGLARQKGVDISEAEYVTFIDQDDYLFGDNALFPPMYVLKREGLEVLMTDFYEENEDGLNLRDPQRFAILHGAFFKRSLFSFEGYHFSKELRQHEDTYLLNCIKLTKQMRFLHVPTYVWRNNKDSQVRQANEISFSARTFGDFMKCGETSYLFAKKYNMIDTPRTDRFIISVVFGLYNMLCSTDFENEKLKQQREDYLRDVYYLFKKYESVFIRNKDILDEIYSRELQAQSRYLTYTIDESFYDFITRMNNSTQSS